MSSTTLPTTWTDSKRHLWPLGAAILLLPTLFVALWLNTGWAIWCWMTTAIVYAAIPLLDKLVGEDTSNPPDAAIASLAGDRYYRLALYASVPVYFGMWFFMLWTVATHPTAWYEWLGLLMATGFGCGLAINIGHELGHQTSPFERFLAKLVLAPGFYGHFYVEHNRGHHLRVATPEDPASARFGESFYEFFPRCVIGSFKSAWEIEAKRLAREGKSVWHYSNDNLQGWAMTAVFWGLAVALFGIGILPFVFLVALYGGSLLEVVNYLEHYGLMRQKNADGRYERCQPQHSWNSNHIVTNVLLYHLQRHSDHHAYPTRSYQTLRHFDGVPELPSGYTAMIMVAYVPWLWFKIMDPKVVAHHQGNMALANIKPSKREAVLRRYAAA